MNFTRSVRQLIDAIGYDLALQLMSRAGGTRVRAPAEPDPRDFVSECIGLEGARLLAEKLGPGQIDVPKGMNLTLRWRNEEIVARYDYGETQRELALAFRLTEKTIFRVIAESRAELGLPPPGRRDVHTPDLFSAEEGAAP